MVLFSFFMVLQALFSLSAVSHLLYRKLYLQILPVLYVFVNSVTVLNVCMHRFCIPRPVLQAHLGVTEWSTVDNETLSVKDVSSLCLCLLLTAVPISVLFLRQYVNTQHYPSHPGSSPVTIEQAWNGNLCLWVQWYLECCPWVLGTGRHAVYFSKFDSLLTSGYRI